MFRIGFGSVFILLFCFVSVYALDEGDLAITVLYDNYPFNKELAIGWGFSCIIEGTEKTILFDIGSSVVPTHMEKLGIKPESVDVVMFSHNHPDHTNGMFAFLKEHSKVTVYVLHSFPEPFKNNVKDTGAECVDVQEPVEICQNTQSTGELTTGVREQALAIKTAKGLVVITGCAHPGIVNIVKKAKEVFHEDDVYLVMGGFHLPQMSNQQIKNIISQLQDENVKKVAPTHCTGDPAIALFKEEYGDDFIAVGVGKKITIEDAFPEETKVIGVNSESEKATTAWAWIKVAIGLGT